MIRSCIQCRLHCGLTVGVAGQVRPLLEAMGRGVIELGADPAAAASAKLIGNFLIVSQVLCQGGVLGPQGERARGACELSVTDLNRW
jgi:phage FluMu protein gp41